MELKLQATPVDIKNELCYRYGNLVGPVKTRHEIVRPHLFWVISGGSRKPLLDMENSHLNNILKKDGFKVNTDGSFECPYPTKKGVVNVKHYKDGTMVNDSPKKRKTSCGTVVTVTPRDMVDFSLSEDDKKFINICMTEEDYMDEDMLPSVGEIDFVKEIKRLRREDDERETLSDIGCMDLMDIL